MNDQGTDLLKKLIGRSKRLPSLPKLNAAKVKKPKEESQALKELLGYQVKSRLDRDLLLGVLESDAEDDKSQNSDLISVVPLSSLSGIRNLG